MLFDLGFNPPPTWATIGYPLANLIPLSRTTISAIPFLDMTLILIVGSFLVFRFFGLFPMCAYLIVFGSIGGFSAYRYILHRLPVATVSLYAYANTVIAVLLGTLVLGETFDLRMGAAALVVLAGVALVRSEPPEAA